MYYKHHTNDYSFVFWTSSPLRLISLLSINQHWVELCDKAISDAYLILSSYCTLHFSMMVNRNTIFISGWKYDELLMKNHRVHPRGVIPLPEIDVGTISTNNVMVRKPQRVECKVKTKWQNKMECISQKGIDHLR